jgi:ligand-binding sensor domain-containing protein
MTMRPVILLLLVGFAGAGARLAAQENKPSVRLLPLVHGEGLSSNRITSIVQDKQGYMWFGTEDGLNRYNGQEIKVFRHVPGDTTSLSSNSIERLLVDRSGLLWITTVSKGLNCYNPLTGTFKVYRHQAKNPNSLPGDKVHALLESRNGAIWIGDDDGKGLVRFDPHRQQFKSYLLTRDTAHPVENRRYNSVRYLLEDRDGTLWVGARDGLYHFDPRTEVVKAFRDKPQVQDHYENLITTLCQQGNDSLWIGYWGGGMKLFNKRLGQYQKTYRHVPVKKLNGNFNVIPAILPKSAAELWVSTHDNGLAVFNKRAERFDFIQVDPINSRNIYPTQTSYLYQDRTGLLWVGTFDGVYCINPYAKAFYSLPLPASGKVGIQNKVAAAHVHAGKLYVGAVAGEGLYVYNRDDAAWRTFPVTRLPHDIKKIIRDHSGNFWVSTSVGVFRLDTLTHAFKRIFPPPHLPPAYQTIRFTRLLADRRGDMWMGTEVNGIFKYTPKDSSFTHYRPEAKDTNSLAGFAILDLLEDRRGNVWIATSGGLSCYNPLSKTFTNVVHDPDKGNSLPARQVAGIVQDNAGNFWIGTGDGLSRLSIPEAGNHRLTLYTTEDGLPANRIYRLVKDTKGRIWMATAKGLSCFDPHQATVRFRNFGQRDGLLQEHLNHEMSLAETGHMLLGSSGRITTFHPDTLLARRPVPALRIYSLKVFDKEARLDSAIEAKSGLQLAYDENFFTLSFALLNFVNPERNQYRYKLEGYDSRWTRAGNRGYATYTKVGPGDYTFRVKVNNNYGGWNEQETKLRISVLPPWWRTWWAYALGLMAVAGTGYASYRRRIDREQDKTRIEKERNRALVAQMNPHFLRNSLNSIDSLIGQNRALEASKYLNRFAKLMNLILKKSQLDAVTLEAELQAIELYIQLEQLRFSDRFSYCIQVSEELEPQFITIQPMLIQPFVENAIRHGLFHKLEKGHLGCKFTGRAAFCTWSLKTTGWVVSKPRRTTIGFIPKKDRSARKIFPDGWPR